MPTNHNGPQLAVGAVVFRDQSVLLIRRGKQPDKGLWSFPGGRVRRGERLHDALIREVMEETGVRVQPSHLVYVADLIERDAQNQIDSHYVVLDYLAHYLGGNIQAKSDAEEAAWINFEQLNQLACVANIVEIINRVRDEPQARVPKI